MNAPASRPAPRRGLGRGLGSLIPTAPPAGEDASAAPADASEGPVLQTVAGAHFADLPIDAVVPNLTAPPAPATKTRAKAKPAPRRAPQNGSAQSEVVPQAPPQPEKVVKERLTIHISVPLIERAKNAVFWTPGLTLADLGERALEALVTQLEKENGGPYQPRPHELKGGRPMK